MPISSFTHGAADAFRNIGDFAVRPGRADRQARRHRPRALRQDRVHHRARAQPHGGRPPAVLRRRRRTAACSAPISSRSRTIRCRASTMSSTSPISPRARRAGRKARAASASFGLPIEYEPQRFWKRQLGRNRLNIDIVDYPGEWLLDLPLLKARLSRNGRSEALEQSRRGEPQERRRRTGTRRSPRSIPQRLPTRWWRERLADLFKAYLRETRADATRCRRCRPAAS